MKTIAFLAFLLSLVGCVMYEEPAYPVTEEQLTCGPGGCYREVIVHESTFRMYYVWHPHRGYVYRHRIRIR